MSAVARFEELFRPRAGTGTHHLIVCQPHPGVTFLAGLVGKLAGVEQLHYVQRVESNYAFDMRAAMAVADRDGVIYLHALATPMLLGWIRAKGLRPVILVRDVAASICAIHEHRLRQRYPVDAALCAAPREEALTYAAYEWGHWILRFQAQWRRAADAVGGLVLDHAAFAADLDATVGQALERFGIASDPAAVRAALDTLADDHELAAIRAGGPFPGGDLPDPVRRQLEILGRFVR